MPMEQIIVLAVVQGITEFLPISSSGHLILIPVFTGWTDQGLVTDVMVHIGSLFAILVYFWRDVLRLAIGALNLVRLRMTDDARLALYIVLATIPAVVFGLILSATGLLDRIRGIEVVGWNAIIFGFLLLVADRTGLRAKTMDDIRLSPALAIGAAQALALIPGTSRSGITITAARFLGYERAEAARFSFLLGIPAIAGAGVLTVKKVADSGQAIPPDALLAAAFTFISAILTIAFMMAMLRRISFTPYVLYRFFLGGFLLVLAYL
jgi:undecaprenyl-diphosphatase